MVTRTRRAHVRYLINAALQRPPSISSRGSSNASNATSPFFPPGSRFMRPDPYHLRRNPRGSMFSTDRVHFL